MRVDCKACAPTREYTTIRFATANASPRMPANGAVVAKALLTDVRAGKVLITASAYQLCLKRSYSGVLARAWHFHNNHDVMSRKPLARAVPQFFRRRFAVERCSVQFYLLWHDRNAVTSPEDPLGAAA